jgi:hypothetical protein
VRSISYGISETVNESTRVVREVSERHPLQKGLQIAFGAVAMKRTAFAFGSLLSSVLLAQKSSLQAPITDKDIIELVQHGATQEEVLRVIATAPRVDFYLVPAQERVLLNAGVSEETLMAMAAREEATPVQVIDSKGRAVISQPGYGSIVATPVASSAVSANSNRVATTAPPTPMPVVPVTTTTVAVPLTPAKPPAVSNAWIARPIPGVLFADQQVDSLIRQALSSRRALGLRLNDVQENLFSRLACETCSQSGYTITVYTPEDWIQLAARQARREMLPFSASDVAPITRLPLLHVNALPSVPDYLNANGFAGASSVHRVVLTDTAGRVTIQPVDLAHSEIETNSALRSASFGTAVAAFRMTDVDSLRALDPKGEFFIVVVGDKQNKYFKVKRKHFQALFGTKTFQPTTTASAAPQPTALVP